MIRKPEKVKEFIRVLEEALPSQYKCSSERREYFRDTIYNAASLTFGKKQAKTVDWFEAHLDERQPSMTRKGVPLPPTKAHPVREHFKC